MSYSSLYSNMIIMIKYHPRKLNKIPWLTFQSFMFNRKNQSSAIR